MPRTTEVTQPPRRRAHSILLTLSSSLPCPPPGPAPGPGWPRWGASWALSSAGVSVRRWAAAPAPSPRLPCSLVGNPASGVWGEASCGARPWYGNSSGRMHLLSGRVGGQVLKMVILNIRILCGARISCFHYLSSCDSRKPLVERGPGCPSARWWMSSGKRQRPGEIAAWRGNIMGIG